MHEQESDCADERTDGCTDQRESDSGTGEVVAVHVQATAERKPGEETDSRAGGA